MKYGNVIKGNIVYLHGSCLMFEALLPVKPRFNVEL